MGWTVRRSNPSEARFSAPVQNGLGPIQPPIQWVPGLSRKNPQQTATISQYNIVFNCDGDGVCSLRGTN